MSRAIDNKCTHLSKYRSMYTVQNALDGRHSLRRILSCSFATANSHSQKFKMQNKENSNGKRMAALARARK